MHFVLPPPRSRSSHAPRSRARTRLQSAAITAPAFSSHAPITVPARPCSRRRSRQSHRLRRHPACALNCAIRIAPRQPPAPLVRCSEWRCILYKIKGDFGCGFRGRKCRTSQYTPVISEKFRVCCQYTPKSPSENPNIWKKKASYFRILPS